MKIILCFCMALLLFAVPARAETVKIGGSGSMIPLLTEMSKAYMKKHPHDTIVVNQRSMGQPGGIAALLSGAVDIAMSARELSPEQKKLPVQEIEIARVAGVVAVSGNVTVKGITSQQLCDIYSGKITNWKQVGGADARILVLTRPESDSTKLFFRRAFTCMARLEESPNVLDLPKSQDMHNALLTKQNAIGPVDTIAFAKAAGKYKALRIDNKGFEGMQSGQWPFVHHNCLVLGNNRGEAVKRFLHFIRSPEGQAIIKADKGVPVAFSF